MINPMLSQGVPMVSGGDEIGRTQGGNNNAYCQDNPINWYHWNLTAAQKDLLEFTRYVIGLRAQNPVLRRRKFFQGRSIRGAGVKDIAWLNPDSTEMNDATWNSPDARYLGVLLSGTELEEVDEKGNRYEGDTLFLAINAHHESKIFVLPPTKKRERWEGVLDTAELQWNRPYTPRDHTYRVRLRSPAAFRLSGTPKEQEK